MVVTLNVKYYTLCLLKITFIHRERRIPEILKTHIIQGKKVMTDKKSESLQNNY